MFYIFSHYINNTPVYERSTPCENRAKERVQELKKWYNYTEAHYSAALPTNYFA